VTLHDLGPEHPTPASESRHLVERVRTESETAEVSGRAFTIALIVIAIAIAALALLLR
jgi:hypothetical protein